jgi:hypothetical protein
VRGWAGAGLDLIEVDRRAGATGAARIFHGMLWLQPRRMSLQQDCDGVIIKWPCRSMCGNRLSGEKTREVSCFVGHWF